VNVKIICKLKAKSIVLPAPKTLHIRLHTRSIIRDGSWAFVGSQSLRSLELDARREVGIIFRDPKVVTRLAKTFEDDWEAKEQPAQTLSAGQTEEQEHASAAKVAKKVAKAVVEDMPPVKPVFELTLRELSGSAPDANLNHAEMEATVKQAVKDAVRQVVHNFVEEAAENENAGTKQ
jgi:hypothetical protein